MLRKVPKGYPPLPFKLLYLAEPRFACTQFRRMCICSVYRDHTRKNSNKHQVIDTVQALEHTKTALHDQVRRVPFYLRADKRLPQANRTRYAAAYPFSAYPKR